MTGLSFRTPACLFVLILLCAALAPATAAAAGAKDGRAKQPSPAALALRKEGGLLPQAPLPAVPGSYFVADEATPGFIFGPVEAYVTSRSCPTAWLMETGEKERLDRHLAAAGQSAPFEYSLVLEEDCPGRVTHATFVFLSAVDAKGWEQWRQQFHKSKTEGYYGAARDRLQKAAAEGVAVGGELRFLSVNGELLPRRMEDVLQAEGRCPPVFDLVNGRRLGK